MSGSDAMLAPAPISVFRRLLASRLSRCCLVVVALYTLMAGYGEAVYQWHQWHDTVPGYQHQDLDRRFQPPSRAHWMGTDALGRDVFARLLQGARIAFRVGIITSLIAIPIGVLLGALAGYFGGKTDDIIVWLYSTFAAIPGLLFILAIAMIAGKGLLGVYLGIGLTMWVGVCRLIRAEVMKQRSLPYVMAGRVLGFSHARILFRHILPNVTHVIIVAFTLRFPASISTEVFMSFLGLGVQGEPSWGIMINNARLRLWQGVWWEMTFVTIAVLLIVLTFNLLGDALRDALDPRLKKVK
ncbi:MAG TPA: ABC transporter permease [Kiritimatiellia bacterium]|nr:ABC transporter permease [Kiritimatiellia bacterium]HMO51432.1 ABC transporter permease [Kiritimatiellia bacterium]HMO97857.1 ABC transporter permease [Kiritimatiellia bacterium]HMP97505.1 ABC transporter permease [Kiritimatiellia bacterium]